MGARRGAGRGGARRSAAGRGGALRGAVERARLGGPLQNTPSIAHSRYLERTLERNRSAHSRASPIKPQYIH